MNNRLKELRKSLKLSQDAFGDKIGLKGSSISYIESGRSALTNQTLLSICKEWNVSKEWLLTGNGEMFISLDFDEEVAFEIGKSLKTQDPFVLNAIFALTKLSPQEREVLNKLLENFFNAAKKNKDS